MRCCSARVKCGIAKPNLSRLENDKVTPKFETLRAIAAALGTANCCGVFTTNCFDLLYGKSSAIMILT